MNEKAKGHENGCAHVKFTRGPFYDNCNRCGATRATARDGKPAGEWHVCALCSHIPTKAGAR